MTDILPHKQRLDDDDDDYMDKIPARFVTLIKSRSQEPVPKGDQDAWY